ncbi:MAG: phosphoribosylformylglycinamidine synthase, partial [Oscillospiraceae bacterium]|nr:phosphoribosylformylglycinamidine synthase [Oscillospiraceae bacterium]
MNDALVARLADGLTQDRGLAAEFLVYMALQRLPAPRRLFFNYRIMGPGVPLAEIDLLLLLPGGLFVIEVKSQLKEVNSQAKHNQERARLLCERLNNLGKIDFPVHSLIVYYNERADKTVWVQGATHVTHRRFLLPTIAWLASQHSLDAGRMEQVAGRLRMMAKAKYKLPKQAKPPSPPAKKKPPIIQPKQKTEDASMVHRIFTGRREGFDMEAQALLREWRAQLHVEGLTGLAVYSRYDVEGIDEALLKKCVPTVFSEPQTDLVYGEIPKADAVFAVEYLPGQYDQRADSCAQCIQIVSGSRRPLVRTARVYALSGKATAEELAAIRRSVINPVECRLARPEKPATLQMKTEPPAPVKTLEGFTKLGGEALEGFLKEYGLAMDLDDLKFCQGYFQGERRDPTVTEIRMIDTYWSDHCRHTTFLTHLDEVRIDDPKAQRSWERFLEIRKELGREDKPVTLMELATQAMRYLKHTGRLRRLDESEEINACTVTTDVGIDGKTEPWLFLFKNETHNHPTEIEPFGGAATCIGGAIRDPLSGRGYVYQAMRVTGAADPTVPIERTMPGKLPQRKITVTAAQGYSSYGNQIGLATGLVDEIYHPGYAAKRLEIGAVVGAVPQGQVRREAPLPGDKVILLGGRTGRDGCGGATGSSKSHTMNSLEACGAEVQKGNAPEERKLQRLFRSPEASRMIKRCNDFGAGGVSVAIGELCDGLAIDLDAVPKKYDGLDGTELAISESQERMAIVVEAGDAEKFIALAGGENLEATVVAEVREAPRLVMKWNGQVVADVARAFLNSNGAEKHARAHVEMRNETAECRNKGTFAERMRELAGSLAVCSRRGLSERFDSTIGAGTVLMPFGGKHQRTPSQVMAAKIPVLAGETDRCSVMAYGYEPYLAESDPYRGAYCAVVESVAKLAAAGCPLEECYLSFQEYFERMTGDPLRWGKPLAALLGAMQAQLDLGIASIGGKDSMSGSFEQLDVPPTLVSFAAALTEAERILSNDFKRAGSLVCR